MNSSPLLLAIAFALIGLSTPCPVDAASAADFVAKGDAFDAEMKTAEALEAYLAAEEAGADDAELLIKIATQYGESMVDYSDESSQKAAGEKALAYALRAVEKDPSNADAQLAVAICYGRLLDYLPAKQKVEYSRQVKSYAEKAIELNPSSDYAWHMLGRWHRAVATTGILLKGIVEIVYGGLPDASLEDSAEAFEKAVSLVPSRVAHHVELGLTYAEMGQDEKARRSIERGLSLPNQERDDPDTKERGRDRLEDLD